MSFGITASSANTNSGSGNSAYADAILSDSPLIYLRFDETNGTIAADSSGNGRNGIYNNSPVQGMYSVVPNSSGRSVLFDSTANPEQSISVPYDTWMEPTALTLTFSCFTRPGNYRLLVTRYGEPGNNWAWFVYANNDRFYLTYRTSGGQVVTVDSGVTVLQGTRYFVAAYIGATECGIRVYGQGGLIGSAIGAGGTLSSSTRNLTISNAETGNYPTTSYMDEFAMFGSVLPAARLDQYAAYAAVFTPKWINRSVGTAARNGTADHTVSFTPAAAGSFLVAVLTCAETTSTAVTAGWTKRVGTAGRTELSVFTRNANAGDATLAVTHNTTNYPMEYVVYEFPSGSSWHSSVSVASAGSIPTLSGLPGTPVTVFIALSKYRQTGDASITNDWWYFWTTDVNRTTLYDGVTEGVYLGTAYFTDFPDTTADIEVPGPQYIGNIEYEEAVIFALTLP